MVKLIVHIGLPGTDSEAITARLGASRHALRAAGVAVVAQPLAAASADPGEAGLFPRLSHVLEDIENAGAHLAIWSDGALSASTTMPVLRRLVQAGHEVEVQGYIPRHDRWLTANYARWALGQRRAAKPAPAFSDWLQSQKTSSTLSTELAAWEASDGLSLRLFNAEAVGDVAAHFFAFNGVADVIVPQPEAPDPGRLLPTKRQLADLAAAQAADIAATNAMLARNGQPPLDLADPSPWPPDPQSLRLLCALTEESDCDGAETETAALARQLAASERQVQALSMQLRSLAAPRAEAFTARLRLALALDDPQALLSADAIATELSRLQSEVAAARKAAEAARRRVEALEASTSWRLTSPLRALGRLMRRPGR